MNQAEEKHLINYLITVKGSSIPQYASDLVTKLNLMGIRGCKVVVSPLFTTDYVTMLTPQAAVWKAFSPLRSFRIVDEGIGTKIRVKESGECLLENPKAVHVITDTIV